MSYRFIRQKYFGWSEFINVTKYDEYVGQASERMLTLPCNVRMPSKVFKMLG